MGKINNVVYLFPQVWIRLSAKESLIRELCSLEQHRHCALYLFHVNEGPSFEGHPLSMCGYFDSFDSSFVPLFLAMLVIVGEKEAPHTISGMMYNTINEEMFQIRGIPSAFVSLFCSHYSFICPRHAQFTFVNFKLFSLQRQTAEGNICCYNFSFLRKYFIFKNHSKLVNFLYLDRTFRLQDCTHKNGLIGNNNKKKE